MISKCVVCSKETSNVYGGEMTPACTTCYESGALQQYLDGNMIKYKRDKRGIDRFYAHCPICLKTVRLVCGSDITRAATGKTPLTGWFGICCNKSFSVAASKINTAIKATKTGVTR